MMHALAAPRHLKVSVLNRRQILASAALAAAAFAPFAEAQAAID